MRLNLGNYGVNYPTWRIPIKLMNLQTKNWYPRFVIFLRFYVIIKHAAQIQELEDKLKGAQDSQSKYEVQVKETLEKSKVESESLHKVLDLCST